jgi:ribosomal protein S18 acetylase RimI-like enzyme
MDPSPVIRWAEPADLPFLWEMLATTADLPPTAPPPVEAIQRDPGMSPYLMGWGRHGDAGVLAEVAGEPVGAAWFRLFPAKSPGYGFVAEDVPELGIGVRAEWRSRGIGRALLTSLIERARAEGYPAISLSVDPGNVPAVGLYRSLEFAVVANEDANPTMLLRLVR